MPNPRSREKDFDLAAVKFSRIKSVDAFNTADVLQNPDPILNTQNRRTTWSNFRDIFWDPHLTAVISSRKSVTTSKDWFIERGKAPARVQKFIQSAFDGFDVIRSTEEILDARFFGMQPMEPVWGVPERFEGENKIFPIEFIGRPPWWFQYDKENKLRFRSKENSWPGEPIGPMSIIVPRNNPKFDNPYGESLLSKVYWSINFKKAAFKYWVEFTEKYGSPFAIGKPPRNAGKKEYDELHEKLIEMVRGSAVTIPNDATIEFLNNNSKASADIFKELTNFCNAEISKAILGQTLTTEAGDKGARALGQVHDNVRMDLAQSDQLMAETCFDILIRWTVDINFGVNIEAPHFKYFHEEDIKKDVAERDKILSEMGVVFTPEYYQETYNLQESDFEIKEPTEPTEPEFQEPKSKFEDQKAVDAFIESLTDKELQKQAKFVQPIIKMIQKAKSFDEANEKLLELFVKIRPEELEKNIGRAIFNTQNLGIGGDD